MAVEPYHSQFRLSADEALRDHARYGWVFFPIRRVRSIEHEGNGDYKAPVKQEWQKIQSVSTDELTAYLARHDVGISCGASNLLVVDIDVKYIYPEIQRDADTIIARLKDLSKGAYATTPSGGLHFYFKQPPTNRIRNKKLHAFFGHKAAWIETRGDGGYVVAYRRYDHSIPPQECPAEIIQAATGHTAPKTQARITPPDSSPATIAPLPTDSEIAFSVEVAAARLRNAVPGERNEALNREAFSLACQPGVTEEHILSSLGPVAIDIGLSEHETRGTISSAVKGAAQQLQQAAEGKKAEDRDGALYQLFERANPHLVYQRDTTDVKTSLPMGTWLEWQADRWVRLSADLVLRRICDLSRQISKSPSTILNQAQATEKLLRLDRRDDTEWNADPRYFLDSEGRLFDLNQRGYVQTPTRDIKTYVQMGTTVDFSESPMWNQALRIWSGGDPDLIEYWQRIFGYCLIPGNPEQIFFYLYGPGENGKSKFAETLQALFGEMAELISDQLFVRTRSSADQRADLAILENKRVAIVHELRQGSHWNEALLKRLTGENTVQVRPLYMAPYNIVMQAKIFLQGNTKPSFTDSSPGWRRRIQVLPFLHRIPPEHRDRYFFEKLTPDLPKVLGWAIKGLEKYQADGLTPSGSAMAATEEYITDYGNSIVAFMEDRCEKYEGGKVSIVQLFEAYLEWRKEQGDQHDTQLSSKRLRAHLAEMGLNIKKASGRTGRVYHLMDYEMRPPNFG